MSQIRNSMDIDRSRWMEQIWNKIKDKTMFDIVIPGTHDSGSYSCSFQNGVAPFSPNIIKKKILRPCIKKEALKWTKTQKNNLFVQLQYGARYLDLRVCVSVIDDEIRTVHSIYGSKYDTLLKLISIFIKYNTKEFLILDFRHFSKETYYGMTKTEHIRFVTMLNNILGSYFVHKDEVSLSLKQLAKKNHRIFGIYHCNTISKLYNWLLPNEQIWDKWANTQTPDELTKKLKEYIVEFESLKKTTPTFFCLQSCITPNNQMIEAFIEKKCCIACCPKKFIHTPSNLIEVAIEANNKIMPFLDDQRKLNIVSFDWLYLYEDFVLMLVNKNII